MELVRRRRWWFVSGGAGLVLFIVLLLAYPGRLPGPHVRDWLGLGRKGPPVACTEPPTRPGAIFRPPGLAPAAGSWREEPSDLVARDELRAAVIGQRVYLATGHGHDATSLRTVTVFDVRSRRYVPGPPAPVPLDHAILVSHRGALYLAGGWEKGRPSKRMWTFSPRTRRWRELASMGVPRAAPAAAVMGDRLYVVGGVSTHFEHEANAMRSMDVYDFRTGRWQPGPAMRTPRHHAGAAAVDGRLYVVGGRTGKLFGLAQLERFDPVQRKWASLTPLPWGVGGLGAVAAGGEVVAISGGNDVEGWVTPGTWGFDPRRGTWRRLPDLRIARHSMAAAVAGDRIYVFGGSQCAGFGRTAAAESLAIASR